MTALRICRLLSRIVTHHRIQLLSPMQFRPGIARHRSSVVPPIPSSLDFIENVPLSRSIFTSASHCAKGKDKGKDKKKGKGKSAAIDENLLSLVTNVGSLKEGMQECIDSMKEDFVNNLSLRSSTGAIEMLTVKVDGDDYQVQDLAQINRKNPKFVILNLSSFPQAIPAVLESLNKSGMDLSPQQDGTMLSIPVPKVTREHREHLSKSAKALFIKYRDRIKEEQNKHNKRIKSKENVDGISSDQVHEAQDMVTHLAQYYIAEAEKLLQTKQKELLKTEK